MKPKKTDYNEIVNDIGQYVHDHIDEPIGLQLLAHRVGVSKYHLNRIFQVITGYQLGEFITRRRMERACAQLADGSASVLEVALSVGYESHSAFSRAFHKVFGFRPSEAAAHSVTEFRIPDTLKGAAPQPLTPPIAQRPAETVAGLSGTGFKDHTYLELAGPLYARVYEVIHAHRLGDPAGFRHIGVSLDNPWQGEHEQARFFAGVVLPGPSPAELETFAWPAGPWAKIVHRGSYRKIWQTVSQVYAGWVIPQGIRLRDAAIVQEYLNDPAVTPETELETHLFFGLLE